MDRHKAHVFCRLTACVLALAATHAWAGNLEPPGPPGPTMKTLQEVEPRTPISSLPFTISQPGSYYLTGSLTGGSGQTGIIIRVSSVTIDLMGFTLQGSSGGFSNAIDIDPAGSLVVRDIVIRNGFIRGWNGYAVFNPELVISLIGVTLQDLRIESNAQGGVSCGHGSRILDCVLSGNGGSSIKVNGSSVVQNCSIHTSIGGATGITVGGEASRIEDNHIDMGPSPSGTGISVFGTGNLIVRNSARAGSPYSINPGNHVGPITNNPATAGPWSNFDMNTAP